MTFFELGKLSVSACRHFGLVCLFVVGGMLLFLQDNIQKHKCNKTEASQNHSEILIINIKL